MAEHITQEQFDDTFEDLKAQPSYLQFSQASGQEPPSNLGAWYRQSVEHVRDQIYDRFDATTEQRDTVDHSFVIDNFGRSSSGSEQRMVLGGFKPAASTGLLIDRDKAGTHFGNIPIEYNDTSALLIHGLPHPDLAFVPTDLRSYDNGKKLSYLGFACNLRAIEGAVSLHDKYLSRIGYDTAKPAKNLCDEVFNSPDDFTKSLLLGYSPSTALSFYLKNPTDLSGWGYRYNTDKTRHVARFRQVGRALLNDRQYRLFSTLLRLPELGTELDFWGNATVNKHYIMKSSHNEYAQTAFQNIGVTALVDETRDQLYGSGTPNHVDADNFL